MIRLSRSVRSPTRVFSTRKFTRRIGEKIASTGITPSDGGSRPSEERKPLPFSTVSSISRRASALSRLATYSSGFTISISLG